MANANAPFGFRPIRSLSGCEVMVNYYSVASGATRIGKGDLVIMVNDGTVAKATGTASTGPWLGVALKDSGAGVAGGIDNLPVCDDPAAVYAVMRASTAAFATTDINQNYSVRASATLNTTTGLSGMKLGPTTTAAAGMRVLARIESVGNESGPYELVEVRFNSSQNAPGSAAV